MFKLQIFSKNLEVFLREIQTYSRIHFGKSRFETLREEAGGLSRPEQASLFRVQSRQRLPVFRRQSLAPNICYLNTLAETHGTNTLGCKETLQGQVTIPCSEGLLGGSLDKRADNCFIQAGIRSVQRGCGR